MIEKSIKQLVQAFQAGSREAFAKLVERYQNMVTSVALANTGDLQRSEDVAQQAFLVAWQKQDELSDPARFGGWIREIAKNVARNERRLKTNVQHNDIIPIDGQREPKDKSDPPELATSRLEQSQLLWTTLEQIPEDYREPMILFYREDKSVANVAAQLGLSQDAVKQRLKRGRAMLRQEIEVMVDRMLFETKPSQAFSASVIAALPAATTSIGASVAKASLVSGAKVVGGKAAASLSAGALLGVLGGALGSLLGIGGAWLGTKKAADVATSEEEKSLLWSFFRQAVALALVFTALMFLTTATTGIWKIVSLATAISIFVPGLLLIINRFNKRQKELHEIHGKPDFGNNGQPQSISTMGLRLNALGMLFGVWSWLIIYSAIRQSFMILAIAIGAALSHAAWIWITAPRATTAPKQIRFNAKICFWSTITQALIVVAGIFFGNASFAIGWDGVSMWSMCGLLLVIGLFVGLMLTIKANNMEKELAAKSKKSEPENQSVNN